MGNNESKPVGYSKFQIDMELTKTVQYIRLNRNRRVEQLQAKESPLLEYPLDIKMTFDQTYHFGCLNARYLLYASTCNLMLQHINILAEHSLALSMFSQGETKKISTGTAQDFYNTKTQSLGSIDDLVPSINTLIFGLKALNIQQVETLEEMLENILGPKYVTLAREGYMVDLRLREKLDSIVPQGDDVESYLFGLVWRLAADDQQKACTIAQNIGLYDQFIAKGHLYRPRNAGNGPIGPDGGQGFSAGNGGERKVAKVSENAFELRQSQFGALNRSPNTNIKEAPDHNLEFKIDPSSKVSQSVLQIDNNFNNNLIDQLEQLKLDDFKPPQDFDKNMSLFVATGPQLNHIRPHEANAPEISPNQEAELLGQLNNLKLDEDAVNMYDELQQNKIDQVADRRLCELRQSKLDPFKSTWMQKPDITLENAAPVQISSPFSDVSPIQIVTPPNEAHDKTFENISLKSFAANQGGSGVSLDFDKLNKQATIQNTKAPTSLPIQYSYNPMLAVNRQQYMYEQRKSFWVTSLIPRTKRAVFQKQFDPPWTSRKNQVPQISWSLSNHQDLL